MQKNKKLQTISLDPSTPNESRSQLEVDDSSFYAVFQKFPQTDLENAFDFPQNVAGLFGTFFTFREEPHASIYPCSFGIAVHRWNRCS